ncbi:hemoglobin subunit alpha-1-like isoform X1 [Betta splendens]|uniref:Hemoglobin subunit alpha-1-like isoform X1 n=1 Tax=Betta splendens TaxID=158456 RepID=A0A6P7NA33_BETSP|nr:hemoglobin subunit alpha-1-like isoform X1 [Betta splendens]
MTSLSAKDKDTVRAFWAKVPGKEELIGADVLSSTLMVYPQANPYFSHFDLSPGSDQMKEEGMTMMDGFGEAVAKMDDLTPGLLNLSQLHAFTLRVDPANFKILSHNLLVVLARMFPKEFTPEVHVSMDKFLSHVSNALSEKPQTEASAVSAQ